MTAGPGSRPETHQTALADACFLLKSPVSKFLAERAGISSTTANLIAPSTWVFGRLGCTLSPIRRDLVWSWQFGVQDVYPGTLGGTKGGNVAQTRVVPTQKISY